MDRWRTMDAAASSRHLRRLGGAWAAVTDAPSFVRAFRCTAAEQWAAQYPPGSSAAAVFTRQALGHMVHMAACLAWERPTQSPRQLAKTAARAAADDSAAAEAAAHAAREHECGAPCSMWAAVGGMAATARYLKRMEWGVTLLRITFEEAVPPGEGGATFLQHLLDVEVGAAWAARWVVGAPLASDGLPTLDLQPTLDLLLRPHVPAAQRARALHMLRAVFGESGSHALIRGTADKAHRAWHAHSAQWRRAGLLRARATAHFCALPATARTQYETPASVMVSSAFTVRRCGPDVETDEACTHRSVVGRALVRRAVYAVLLHGREPPQWMQDVLARWGNARHLEHAPAPHLVPPSLRVPASAVARLRAWCRQGGAVDGDGGANQMLHTLFWNTGRMLDTAIPTLLRHVLAPLRPPAVRSLVDNVVLSFSRVRRPMHAPTLARAVWLRAAEAWRAARTDGGHGHAMAVTQRTLERMVGAAERGGAAGVTAWLDGTPVAHPMFTLGVDMTHEDVGADAAAAHQVASDPAWRFAAAVPGGPWPMDALVLPHHRVQTACGPQWLTSPTHLFSSPSGPTSVWARAAAAVRAAYTVAATANNGTRRLAHICWTRGTVHLRDGGTHTHVMAPVQAVVVTALHDSGRAAATVRQLAEATGLQHDVVARALASLVPLVHRASVTTWGLAPAHRDHVFTWPATADSPAASAPPSVRVFPATARLEAAIVRYMKRQRRALLPQVVAAAHSTRADVEARVRALVARDFLEVAWSDEPPVVAYVI